MAHGESPRHKPKPKPKTKPKSRASTSSGGDPKGASGPSKTSGTRKANAEATVAGDRSIRLQKLLAGAGFGSRRDVERFLAEERVTVNGRVASVGDKADPSVDEIRFDGERLLKERPTYWLLNKPRGVVTTVRDNEGRRTVINLLPSSVGRVFPVGRLDKETSGLLLMTNDGDVAHALLHPSLGNEREYRVNVKGHIDSRAIGRLERGVQLEEGRTAPVRVSQVRFDADSGTSSLSLTLVEGKKRQIRRSLLVLGFPVRRLVRVRMGPLRIGRLAIGEARPLRSEEKRALLEHVRRLQSGEAPLAAAVPTERTRRARSDARVPARPPRKQTTRRTRGASSSPPTGPSATRTGSRRGPQTRTSTGSSTRTPTRKSLGRPSPRDSKRDSERGTMSERAPARGRERPARKAGATRKSGATRNATGSKQRSSDDRPKSRPPRKAGTKPAARKQGTSGRQRTASSRKGVRK